MADRLTQLQTSLDQLLTQMLSTIHYIDTHHPSSLIPGQSDQTTLPPSITTQDPSSQQHQHTTDAPPLFHARLTELAQDLILKEQQCEALIASLPGLGNSQREQEERIRVLEGELGRLGGERRRVAGEREELLRRVEGKIVEARRV